MNLAIGSALACIGLTVPVVWSRRSPWTCRWSWASNPIDIAMLAITLLVSAFTLGTGRTHMMQGAVHLVILRRSCSWRSIHETGSPKRVISNGRRIKGRAPHRNDACSRPASATTSFHSETT